VLDMIHSQKIFLSKYNHTQTQFDNTGLKWEELLAIADDYEVYKQILYPIAQYLNSRFMLAKEVHSVRYRLKDTEHLIDKIIRKRKENQARVIDLSNYKSQITDLIGIRIIHLFKDNWQPIHEFLCANWDLAEEPTAYFREGDSTEITKGFKTLGCKIKPHPFGYRSVHYLLKCAPEKETVISEVQVRTIFEEAWSEIDHIVRYPNHTTNVSLNHFLNIFNRLVGSSDEMGTFVVNLKKAAVENEESKKRYEERINQLEQKINESNSTSKLDILEYLSAVRNAHNEIDYQKLLSTSITSFLFNENIEKNTRSN